jgi:hypothetical protein
MVNFFKKSNDKKERFLHNFQKGDHVIRWTSVMLYPIQVHGIVLSASDDVVTIVDFGLTASSSASQKDTKEKKLQCEGNDHEDHNNSNSNSNDHRNNVDDDDNNDADENTPLEEMINHEDRAMIETCDKHRDEIIGPDRINILVLIDEKDIKQWKKVEYAIEDKNKKKGKFNWWWGKDNKEKMDDGDKEQNANDDKEKNDDDEKKNEKYDDEKRESDTATATSTAIAVAKSDERNNSDQGEEKSLLLSSSSSSSEDETSIHPQETGEKTIEDRDVNNNSAINNNSEEIIDNATNNSSDENNVSTHNDNIEENNENAGNGNNETNINNSEENNDNSEANKENKGKIASTLNTTTESIASFAKIEGVENETNSPKRNKTQSEKTAKEIPESLLTRSDPTGIVLARVRYLVSNPHILPPHNILYSNSECIAVWCKTGTWSTIQASFYLHSTAAGNFKSAICAATAVGGSTVTTTVPATGIAGFFGMTTTSTVSLVSMQPWLIPALAGYGIIAVGGPYIVLRKCHERWRRATIELNDKFWSELDGDVYVEAIKCWSGLE